MRWVICGEAHQSMKSCKGQPPSKFLAQMLCGSAMPVFSLQRNTTNCTNRALRADTGTFFRVRGTLRTLRAETALQASLACTSLGRFGENMQWKTQRMSQPLFSFTI